MKKVLLNIFIVLTILLVGCFSSVTNKEKNAIKEVVDKVLSYDPSYDDGISDFVDEEDFYISNYQVFYSFFLGDLSSFNYSSEVKSIKKNGEKYTLCMILNMKAEGELVFDETVEDDEGHRGEAEGENIPVQVTVEKEDDSYKVKSVKEYDSLDDAIEENSDFK